jgi:hypothetical protein
LVGTAVFIAYVGALRHARGRVVWVIIGGAEEQYSRATGVWCGVVWCGVGIETRELADIVHPPH